MAKKTSTKNKDILKGTISADVLTVKHSQVTVNAGKGNDKINVTKGSRHKIVGEAGNDTIVIAAKAGSGSKICGDDVKSRLKGNDAFNIKGGKKNYFYGGKGADTFTVNGGTVNYIYGGAGNDVIVIGQKSNGTAVVKDFSVKKGNTDKIKVAGGKVKSIAVSGKNMIIKGGKSASLTLRNAKNKIFTVTDTLGKYTVSGTKVNLVLGRKYKGSLTAASFITSVDARSDANAVTIKGNAKNNVIYGGAGANALYGYAGNDRLYGGAGNDRLYGGAGNDRLYGGAGNDRLYGGAGDDMLTGGGGNDTFVYSYGHDIITDYVNDAGEKDVLRIEGRSVDNVTVEDGSNVKFTIASGTVTLTDAADKAVIVGDARGSYAISKLAADPTVTLGKDYTGSTFDAGNLAFVQTIDAAGSMQAITLTGNAGNNVIYAGQGGTGMNGGAGDDSLIVDGRYSDTLTGGTGSDTYVVNKKLTSGTVLTINQGDYLSGDEDKLQFQSINKEDVIYSLQGNALTIMHSSGGTLSVSDWNTNPLRSVTFANGSVSDAEINARVNSSIDRTVTQQSVIKSFMRSLDDTTMIAGADDAEKTAAAKSALDVAVTFASNYKYTGWDSLVSSFINDIYTYAKMDEGNDDEWMTVTNSEGGEEKIIEPGIDRFLKEYCGITLLNEDTGSITGSDAGGATVKTADTIVPETTGSLDNLIASESSATTINGLTFRWPEELTAEQQTMVNAINTWWAREGLNLIEESYGMSFTEEGTTVTDIDVVFKTKESSTLASVTSRSYENGESFKLTLTINMKYYDEILDENGASTATSEYLDRTLAHELTHAVMAANITNFKYLPKCVKEGTADLVHGVDDERINEILGLVNLEVSGTRTTQTTITKPDGTQTTTTTTLPLSEARKQDLQEAMQFDGDGYYAYAGGYMLLRYFAKHVVDAWNGESPGNSGNMLASNGTGGSSSNRLLNLASIQADMIDFADTPVSDSLGGIQQDESKTRSLFITGNV